MNHATPSLTAVCALPGPIDLADEVWGLEHICEFMKQKKRSLYPLVNSEDFPLPLNNQKRNRRWLASSVRAYFANKQGCVVQPTLRSVPNVSYVPSTIITKKKRKEVA
jgi:predicted DNA-binding transcriptional regulator AlpA